MGNQPPTVSIVLPTYNRAVVLDRSIRSVLEQTYTDFELIVVDDDSTDDTEEVVEGYDDPRVRYLEHDYNQGAAAARNTGIGAAYGDFIAFQDSDDEWLPRKLEKQMAVFERSPPEVGVVYSAFLEVAGRGERRIPGSNPDWMDGDHHRRLLKYNFITTQAAVVRRDCFRTVGGFDEHLPRLMDWELWIRLSEPYRFEYIDEPLVRVYRQPDSISQDDSAVVEARELILEKHRERFAPEELAAQLFWVGHGSLKLGQGTQGRRYLARALRTDLRMSYAGAFLLSLLGSRVYRAAYAAVKSTRQILPG